MVLKRSFIGVRAAEAAAVRPRCSPHADRSPQDEESRRIVTTEVSVMKRMEHPNIVTLFDATESTSRGRPALMLLMEYCAGAERPRPAPRPAFLPRIRPTRSLGLGQRLAAAQAGPCWTGSTPCLRRCRRTPCGRPSATWRWLCTSCTAPTRPSPTGTSSWRTSCAVPPYAALPGRTRTRALIPRHPRPCPLQGEYKLCDFGSCVSGRVSCATEAERAAEEDRIERTTTLMYRAPEMVDFFGVKAIDHGVDVWVRGRARGEGEGARDGAPTDTASHRLQALGCILYSLAFRAHPFQNKGKLAILCLECARPRSPRHAFPSSSPCMTPLFHSLFLVRRQLRHSLLVPLLGRPACRHQADAGPAGRARLRRGDRDPRGCGIGARRARSQHLSSRGGGGRRRRCRR